MKSDRLGTLLTTAFLSLWITGMVSAAPADPLFGRKQNTPLSEENNAVLDITALRRDPSLNRIVPLHFDAIRMDKALRSLNDQGNLKLTTVANLAPRRITARCKRTSTATFMMALSHVLGGSWRKSGETYLFFQTAAQRKAETDNKRASERREQLYIDAQGNMLRSQVQTAISRTGADRDVFADFLAGCDADTMNKGVGSALEDEPILSAVDQSHFYNHFLSPTPLAMLPSAQQQAVRQIARDSGYSHLDPGASVGLVAAAGGFRLGIVEPDGKDLWVAPQHSIGGVATVTQSTRENDFDPRVVAQLRSDRLVELGALTETLRHKKPKGKQGIGRSHLGTVLQEIAEEADIDFLCDGYLNSAQTTHAYTPDPTWTAEAALRQIARTFGHRMTYHDGLLEVATVTPGLDLRLEPPIAVMNSLDAQLASGHLPQRQDLLILSLCTQEQLQILELRHPVVRKTHTGHLLQALRIYPFLHFYGSLSAQQQQRALTENGVRAGDLSLAQHQRFDELLRIGIPKSTPARYRVEKGRFYLKFNSVKLRNGIHREVITFIATTPETARACRSAGL